jgi:hypothetical protein
MFARLCLAHLDLDLLDEVTVPDPSQCVCIASHERSDHAQTRLASVMVHEQHLLVLIEQGETSLLQVALRIEAARWNTYTENAAKPGGESFSRSQIATKRLLDDDSEERVGLSWP